MSFVTNNYDLIRFRSCVSLVRIKDREGRLQDLYGEGKVLPPWVAHDPEQVARFVARGLIEPCDLAGKPTDPGRIIECLSALSACGVPRHAGRPRAANMLRSEGLHYSNETISQALLLHKSDDWKYPAPFPWANPEAS